MMIGHTKNKTYFKNIIDKGMLGHAYLFSGPEMIGKKMFAEGVYKIINGREIYNDPDFKLAGSQIKDARNLKAYMAFKPYVGPYKFAVIDDAHKLTTEASNALLKVLEEPPSFSMLILITSMPKLLPQTILSRCEEVRFLPATESETEKFVRNRISNKEDGEFLIKLCQGRLGLIQRLVDEKGVDEAKRSVDDLRKLLRQGIFERMQYAKKVHDKKINAGKLVGYWLNWLHANIDNSPQVPIILKDLIKLNRIVSQSQFNHRLALENFLIKL
jgi:DNA polymerase III subunit delta'